MTLRTRIADALAAGHGRAISLAEDISAPDEGMLTDAAVLIAIVDRPAPGVILTQRTAHLRRHAGQVAFPGGRVDPGDADAVAAALREAEEEIGLPRGLPDVIGAADRFVTRTGYAITPVVAIVPPDLALVPQESEVAAIFEVPLAYLLDPANHIEAAMDWEGRPRRYVEIPWPDHRIWGVTAALIVNLGRRLEGLAA